MPDIQLHAKRRALELNSLAVHERELVKILSETIKCDNCGFLLYWGEAIKDRLYMRFSEAKLLEKYKNVCPNCGNKLDEKKVRVQTKP